MASFENLYSTLKTEIVEKYDIFKENEKQAVIQMINDKIHYQQNIIFSTNNISYINNNV